MTRHMAIGSPSANGEQAVVPAIYTGQGGPYSARQIWSVIRRYELLLGAIVCLTVLAVLLSQWSATPIYRATATIQVELNDEKGTPEVAGRNRERVLNEAGLYASRSVAERVAKDLNLPSDPRFTKRPLPPGQPVTPQHLASSAGTLMSMADITPASDGDFIKIEVTSPSADLAADVANQYAASLAALRTEDRDQRRTGVVRDLEQQRSRLANEARQAEQALADFRRANQMLVGAGGEADLAQINQISIEAASAQAMRAAQGARAAGVSAAVSNRSVAGASSPLLDQQQRRLDELIRERSDLSVTYGPQHPRMQSVDAQIGETRRAMQQEQANVIAAANARTAAEAARERGMASSEAAAASARSSQLQGQLRNMISKAYANTANMVELNALERRAIAAREAYLATAKMSQEVQSSLDAEGVHSTLVSPAAVPGEPISPRPKSATFAAFAGSLMLGLLLIAAIELTDNRLWNADQIARHFGLPTFAMLPDLGKESRPSAENNPVTEDPQSLYAEVCRGLAAEVADLARHGRTQTVLITSPVMGDGKSTVALSLAAAAAASGRRAVVVDLDLRRPVGTILRSVQEQAGGNDIVAYLSGNADIARLLPSPTLVGEGPDGDVHQPVVLSAAEPVRNPSTLMRLRRVNRLLAELHQQFDLIVINAPAALATRDARMLIEAADHTLMVVRWGRTTVEQVRATLQVLQEQVDGVVLNRVDYAEHARRGYGDSVQFYMDSAEYYSGSVPQRASLRERLAVFWRRNQQQDA
ncbi:GumC family protein [Sphingomonas arenae]|uniref:GumC family protein n=1 Tax=Sphingomonas arenae TaxID=2812555 RepID=UPI001967F764|nr:succinoglycan biosynthesis protein exop [Sphingomonas arenae]